MNSYFASVEQQANPFLRGKPVGITGKQQERSIIATASLEAKRLGVKTAMSTGEAKRICPSMILYQGDPEKYADIMHRFNAIYQDFTDKVEVFSVDESFLNLTQCTSDYLGATCIALEIRERIKKELGEYITASIGIAPNRLMAKLSAERVKPNGLTVTPPNRILELLDQSSLQDLCGIGPHIEKRLHSLGIVTFEQLRQTPRDLLIQEFKNYGIWLHEASWGREILSPITINHHNSNKPKSYGHSYTLPYDTHNTKEMQRYLLGLCDRITWRMRKDHCAARRISVYLRYEDFSSTSQQRLLDEPMSDGLTLFKTAWRMIDIWRNDTKGVRLLGVSASALTPTQQNLSLFKREQRFVSIQQALDHLQHRYGEGIWTRASLLDMTFKTRSSGFHFDHEL